MKYTHSIVAGLCCLSLVACLESTLPEETTVDTQGLSSSSSSSSSPTEWQNYRSQHLGFSLRYPKSAYVREGSCDGNMVEMPLKIFENRQNEEVFLSQLQLTYNIKDPSKCRLVPASFAALESYGGGSAFWHVRLKTVKDDRELETYLQDFFGKNTRAIQTPAFQEGVVDIALEGGCGASEDALGCPLDSSFIVKYSPAHQRVAVWQMEGDPKFWDQERKGTFDAQMRDSFRFE